MTVAIPFNADIDLKGNTLKNPAFDAGAIANSALATNPLARANHTGAQTASTISDLATVVQAYRLDQFAAPTADISLNSHKLTNVTTPTASTDGATKGYVDSLVNGTKWLGPVICATTANITLSGEQTIDGIVTNASRVLVKNQTTASQNGIYVSASGAWARSADLASGVDAANATMFIEQGTTYADTQFTCTTNTGSAVVGTNNLAFTQIGAGTTYSDDGATINITGTTVSVRAGGIGSTQLASGAVTIAKLGTITDGATLDQSGSGSSLEVKTGGISATQLASNAVTTAKILDANVTAAKLATVTDGTTLDQSGSGATLEVKSAGITATQLASNAVTTAKILDANVTDAKLASTFCKKYAASFGNGSLTSFTITHGLGTSDVTVTVYNNSTGAIEFFNVVITSSTVVTISCNGTAPSSNAYRVVVIG